MIRKMSSFEIIGRQELLFTHYQEEEVAEDSTHIASKLMNE